MKKLFYLFFVQNMWDTGVNDPVKTPSFFIGSILVGGTVIRTIMEL